MGNPNKLGMSRLLKLLFVIELLVLFANVLAISRDYQDSWVLEGLEIHFVLFVATYALAFFSEKRISWMVALAVIGRCAFLLIPNLKYVCFQGVYIDQHTHYALANYIYNEGYVATQGPFGVSVYGKTPLIHLTSAIFSIVLNISVVDSVKYLPVFVSPIYPLLTYVIMKNMKLPGGMTALKYALFISSIPLTPGEYLVTGSQFGVLLAFLILSSLIILLQKRDQRHWLVFVLLIFALATAHSVSSVLFTFFLLIITLLQKVSYFRVKSFFGVSAALTATSISLAWLMFSASFAFNSILHIVFVGVPSGATPPGSELGIAPLFELARVNMLGAIGTLLVFEGAEAFLLLLTLAGLIVLVTMHKQTDNVSKFLSLFCGLTLLFVPIGFLSKAGGFRVLHLASLAFPIFTSIFLLRVGKKRIWMHAAIFSSIILLATLQLYSCQPLVAPASSLSTELPADEPIRYVNRVNSIYQRRMIDFAWNYLRGWIACDSVTGNQIIGLTGFNFSGAHLVWDYSFDKSRLESKYDFFLIHLPGKSGALDEGAEIRTKSLILEAVNNSSVIYTNGESFVLSYPFLSNEE